ncbi:MAG TPA: DUF2017 family protein [Acidimicrobiales bacterium]|nr:DUF2017 family protein [Acidimicrobiales bacterium]
MKRTRRGDFELALPAAERELLRSLPEQLRQLLESPDDPDLRRLFPPAYAGTGDEEVAAEADYRDAMGSALVERHRAAFDVLEATVDADRLDAEQASAWLSAVNDVRLVLGTRLDVSEDQAPVPPDDARAPAFAVYSYLSWLAQQLVEALAGGL